MNGTNHHEPATDEAAGDDRGDVKAAEAALGGAQLIEDWYAAEGGWPSLLRGSGARLAAAGYRLAARALDAKSDALLSPGSADLQMTPDGQFLSERLLA